MKNIIIWASLSVAVTALSSCGSEKESEELKFTTVKVEKSVAITQEDGAPHCCVMLSLPVPKADKSQRAKTISATIAQQLLDIDLDSLDLKQAADSFANSYTRNYQKDFTTLFREDRNDPEKRSWYEYHYNITGDIKTGRKGVTIYSAIVDYYEGGAHGINQRIVMNFDNHTGKLLTLADVFLQGFEMPLNEKLQAKLMEITDTKDMDALHEKGYLYSMDIFAPENFCLGDDAITFIYNPYEIASYSEGIIEVELDYSELKDILRK